MFKHILLPLDGSQLAEAAIPITAEIASKLKARVTLLHVIEKNAPHEIHGQRHLSSDEEACQYLNRIKQERFPSDLEVECHVHTEEVSQVARSIVEHYDEFSPDLIILSAHGEGGLRDIMVGSIASQVIAYGAVPVMLLQPEEDGTVQYEGLSSLLVGMDGNPEHDTCLEVAGSFAQKADLPVHLIQVVPTLGTLDSEDAASGTLLPATTIAMLDIAEDAAAEYLQEKLDVWRSRGLQISAEVTRGDPSIEVGKSADTYNASIIVLGTHGKKGMDAFWAGSVAPRIVANTKRPVLLVPIRR